MSYSSTVAANAEIAIATVMKNIIVVQHFIFLLFYLLIYVCKKSMGITI